MMTLPNLFIPGAAKSGTSALHQYLDQHPEVYMSEIKEPHFFSHDEKYVLGIQEYAKIFQDGCAFKIRGESSTGYMVFPKVIDRITKHIPNPKFIFVLRNPVDRAYSHYWWLRGMGYEEKPFREAFVDNMYSEPDAQSRIHGEAFYKFYYQMGCYDKWLLRFLEAFGQDNLFVVSSEYLRKSPLATLNCCCDFLEISPFSKVDSVRSNETVILSNPKIYQQIVGTSNPSLFRMVARSLFPQAIKARVKRWLTKIIKEKFNTKGGYRPLSDSDRRWVASFYLSGVELLREILNYEFREWEKDFPFS